VSPEVLQPARVRSMPRLALPVLACCGGLPVAAIAQPPVWKQPTAKQAVTPEDRWIVALLDRAWSTGKTKRVLNLFEYVHPQAMTSLARRVMRAPGRRTSKILAATQYDRCRCLYLDTELTSGTKTHKQFEVLVLVPDRQTAVPRLLYATDPTAQSRVRVPRNGREIHGLPFGPNARFACPACNYTVGSPDMGNWLVFAGSDETQSIEKIDVFNLDKDLAMELAVHMSPETAAPVPLSEIVQDAAAEMETRLRVEPTNRRRGKLQVAGLESPYESMDIHDPRTGHVRRFLFLAVRKPPSCYLILFQGSPDLVSAHDKDVVDILGTFRLLDPKRSVAAGEKAMLGAHMGGKLEGNTFVYAPLGLRLTGVAGWKPQIGIGKGRFQAIWNCPVTKSQLMVSGLDWRKSDSEDALSMWLGAWLDKQSKIHKDHGFHYAHDVTTKTIGGRKFHVLEYEFRPEGKKGVAKAQLAVRVQGDTLIVIDTIAMPGPHQAENVRLLEKRIDTLELQ